MREFFKSLLDPKKSLSFGRFMALFMTSNVLTWDAANLVFAWRFNTYHLLLGQAPLDLLPAGGTLLAQAGFCATFYGVTKYGDIKTAGAATSPDGAPAPKENGQ